MRSNAENTLGALSRALSDEINESVHGLDLMPSELEAVGHIGHAPGMAISDLAQSIALSHAATVRLVRRLEAKGLITRAHSQSDSRVVLLHLSKSGKSMHDGIMSHRTKKLRHALNALTVQEQKILASFADRMLRKILRDESHAYRICRLCDRDNCSHCPIENEMADRELQND